MKSKTSFFNPTVLKKDILRYAPVWGGYTIFLLLILFGLADESYTAIMAENVKRSMNSMVVLNLIYGGICGAFLFMDLFNGRLCNALHAFPLRRESWLTTHITAGVLFSLVPNLLVTLLGNIILWDHAYMAFIWLAVSTLQFLFFFGTAVLAAACAGNLIGMAAIYGIIHFITLLVCAVVELFYAPLLYGIQLDTDGIFEQFFPMVSLTAMDYVDYSYVPTTMVGHFNGFVPKSWLYLGICAAVGILCMFLAWRVYRRRNLESAGDLLSLQQLSPLFLIICTIGAGAILYLSFGLFEGASYVSLAVGLAVGYFAGRMLLNRTVKVFTKKAFLGFGVLVAVLAGSFAVTWLDPLGITRYVPELDKIESAAVVGADKRYNYAESFGEPDEFNGFAITDREELVHLQDFHRQLTQYRPGDSNGTLCEVQIIYNLDNGRTVKRRYYVEQDTSLGIRAGKYFSDIRYIFEVNDPTVLYEAFESISVEIYADKENTQLKLTDQQEIAGLLDAIKADCEAGDMAQNWAYHQNYGDLKYYLDFSLVGKANKYMNWTYFTLQVYPDCTNTIAYIREMVTLHPELE